MAEAKVCHLVCKEATTKPPGNTLLPFFFPVCTWRHLEQNCAHTAWPCLRVHSHFFVSKDLLPFQSPRTSLVSHSTSLLPLWFEPIEWRRNSWGLTDLCRKEPVALWCFDWVAQVCSNQNVFCWLACFTATLCGKNVNHSCSSKLFVFFVWDEKEKANGITPFLLLASMDK